MNVFYMCVFTTTIKIQNISITPKDYLVPLHSQSPDIRDADLLSVP